MIKNAMIVNIDRGNWKCGNGPGCTVNSQFTILWREGEKGNPLVTITHVPLESGTQLRMVFVPFSFRYAANVWIRFQSAITLQNSFGRINLKY
jgi:hypothetical protein